MKFRTKNRNPWLWVPTLYYAEGIPYVIVMIVSVIMYKRLGVSNTDIALYTSWLYLPWVIKPLWSPIVDILKTKRFWIIAMQLIVGAGLAGVALTIPVPNYFRYTLAFFWLLAFSSATHDIAADGFYMLGLSQGEQAFFVGIRSTFYRLAMITGQGLLVILAGYLESATGLPTVRVNVNSNPQTGFVEFVNPDSMNFESLQGDLRVVVSQKTLDISTRDMSAQEADSIINAANEWNIKNHFVAKPKSISKVSAENEPGWFDKNIINPLEIFLRNTFGREDERNTRKSEVKNIGPVYFHLSKEPESDDDIVVNFGFASGDKSIFLIQGERFTFNKSNWNKPAIAVIELDPKLKWKTSAVFEARAGNVPLAWIITLSILAGLFLLFFLYHKFILPYPDIDKSSGTTGASEIISEFLNTFALFFKRKGIGLILGFLLLYRFGEAQLAKIASPFLLDAKEAGGLGLTTGDYGIAYGTIGVLALTAGGILGGWLASKKGLKYWLWWMLIAMNLPNVVYVYLSAASPDSFAVITACIAIEQFGYGFGFTAYMLYMIYISDGEFKTAHFAIATGFMALGMMIPGMFSGWLQEIIGYHNFFIWVVLATIPGFIIAYFIDLDPNFGKKENSVESS